MTISRKKQIAIQTAQSEAGFLLAWADCLDSHTKRLMHLTDRYPQQRDNIMFCIKETQKEIVEIHEERAHWLTKLDEVYQTDD